MLTASTAERTSQAKPALAGGLAGRWTAWLGDIVERVGVRGAPTTAVLAMFAQLSELSAPSPMLTLTRKALTAYVALSADERLVVLRGVATGFGVDEKRLGAAVAALGPAEAGLEPLRAATETRRQRLIRRLNTVPEATAILIAMRADVLRHLKSHPELSSLDADLLHVFEYWFSAGFLMLQRIDWFSSARLLRQLIEHEAVHEIGGWEDLRRRLEPSDRRCYAFFHPGLNDAPLIFVEVALTTATPGSIVPLLAEQRQPIAAQTATTAVFYSISNCQPGLKGIPFGNMLIKRVVEVLAQELPRLKTFVTLSPVPQLADWLKRARAQEASPVADLEGHLKALDAADWTARFEDAPDLQRALRAAAARFLLHARARDGRASDPVARFHLGNGARLEAIHLLADPSARGLRQSHGVMVNYRYDLNKIDQNHDAFHRDGRVVASRKIMRMGQKSAVT